MTTQSARGFTIIEIMLFMAITGLLTVGALVGSSNAIAQQRYRDSVNSLKGFIQEQYSETTNVTGSEAKSPACRRSGDSLVFGREPAQPRGTSDCLLLGRYLLVEPTRVKAQDVIGLPKANEDGSDDIAALQNYSLSTSDKTEIEEVAWGATIVRPKTTTGLTVSVLILRSPLSGSVLTFVQDGNHLPATMIRGSNMAQQDLCVDSGAGAVTSKRFAVRINARASGQSSIEIPPEGDSVCD